ncbi:MAG: hypothetical protein LBL35_04130, partial [Clostridiales bacterium]|nr:hypothetical protein [Clostridiales bacterium]
MRNDNEKARNLRRLNPASVARFRETYDDAIREDSYDEKRKKPSRFALFYIITLLAAVIACVAVFAVFFTRIRRDREESLPSVTDSVTPEIEEKAVVSETRQITCVITFKGADFIEVTDVENGQAHTLNVGRGSKFKNERNQTITVSDLSVGQVLEGSFDTRTSVADAMSLSAKTWEQKLVSGVSVSANALVYGNDILKYDENTVIMYKEKKISASGA